MKLKHTVEISALDLALFLKEKLNIQEHHANLDLEVIANDTGGFSAPTKGLRTLKVTWTEGEVQRTDQWEPGR